ncbi:hypothetical protein ACJ41O_003879 [Fusarium nematophilum]
MNKILLLAFSASSALATLSSPFLAERQVVAVPCDEQGLKDCGQGCIQTDWTCCPSRAGGCPPTAYCDKGTNGEYGCCPSGSVCGGEGGANTRGHTNTITIPGTTTTIITAETDTDVLEPPYEPSSSTTTEMPEPEPTTLETAAPEPGTYGPGGVPGTETGGLPGTGTAGTGGIPRPGVPGTDTMAAPPEESSYVPPVIETQPNTQPAGTPVPLPTPEPEPTVIVNAGSTREFSWIGGLMAGVAALLI